MATPDRLSHSEQSIPEMNTSSDVMQPSTPPYYFPKGSVMKSSTTNIDMQSNPMYHDTEPVAQRRTSQKQVVVEKINEGNPDSKSPSSNIIGNVKIYERLDTILPKLSLSPRYSYSPSKKTDRDSTFQYVGSINAGPQEALEGLPLSPSSSKANSITRLSLQIFFSVILILTLFVAVVALVTAVLSISASNAQTAASLEVARKLDSLTPLINANSTYGLLVQNITATQRQLIALRNETLHSIAALQVATNCSVQVRECVVSGVEKTCTTDSIPLDMSAYRVTGMFCVPSDVNTKAVQIAVTDAGYKCLCSIEIAQPEWTCKLSLFICYTGN